MRGKLNKKSCLVFYGLAGFFIGYPSSFPLILMSAAGIFKA